MKQTPVHSHKEKDCLKPQINQCLSYWTMGGHQSTHWKVIQNQKNSQVSPVRRLCWLGLKVRGIDLHFKQESAYRWHHPPSPICTDIWAGHNSLSLWRKHAQGHASKWLLIWQKGYLTAHMPLHIFMHPFMRGWATSAGLGPTAEETQQLLSQVTSQGSPGQLVGPALSWWPYLCRQLTMGRRRAGNIMNINEE